ncbi:hypothetical protein [Streptomyces flavidovirens]
MRIALFLTCCNDTMFPDTGLAAAILGAGAGAGAGADGWEL